jgi:PAS domain S-box-containing protein
MNLSATELERDEPTSARDVSLANESMFQQMFERSADAILLFHPGKELFVDCNQAAVEMMRATNKQQLLMMHPADLSPEFQPDGRSSREKTPEEINLALRKGSHRFEWRARRIDGTEFSLEVLLTTIQTGEHPLMATVCRDITERKASEAALGESEEKFRELFEASADAISILDPQTRRFITCNGAAVKIAEGPDKSWFLSQTVEGLAPERQPDGRSSREAAQAWVERALAYGTQRFEWVGKRFTGKELPMEMLLTPTLHRGTVQLIVVARDISERKKAEREMLELNQSLERHVEERTAALKTSEARFRALVEHAAEAIVVFDGHTGRFLFGNEHACRLYGVPMEKLAALTPAEVSPEFQPGGRRSSELAREKMDQALAGATPVFEWTHQRPDGCLIPTEVRLLRLPAEGQNLIRASIIDNTDRHRAERALRESEAKFRALFEGSSQGVVLHDESGLREVNPAAVRIMGRQFAHEMLGKHPSEMAPPFQPNGESSEVMARNYIQECMSRGSARFEWLACAPDGREIPLEVALTRIEWSGRKVIQAFITDITERKRVQTALAESEARFSAAFHASPALIGILRMSDGKYVLANDAHLTWLGYAREEVLGRTCLELGMWENPGERDLVLKDMRTSGSIRQKECRWLNRRGERFTVLLSAETIKLDDTPHMLVMALDITQRKRAEEELRASEAELRESEARFSVAFQASPTFISILRMNDGAYVLANDAFVNWLGLPREEVIGRTSAEFGMWEDAQERDEALSAMRTVGSIRDRECRWRNRQGETLTVLLSAETIKLHDTPHILSFALDITQRKRAEEELRASEARLRESEGRFSAAFRASPVAITISGMEDGRTVLANEAFLKWTGYRLDEVLGRNSQELSLWADPAEREPFWEELRRAGFIHEREVRVCNRHGKILTLLLSADVIEIDRVPHLLTVGLDISQRKQVEVELHRTLAREKELSQLKSNFVSMVSHEFRTPLGIIQSSAELLRDFHEKMQPTERHEQLESVSRNARRMAGMMEEVLVLSRLDAGKLDFQPAPLDLNAFCRRVVDEVLSATSRRCAIELTLSSIPIPAQVDERLLGHILTNLLSNAVKYSEAGAAAHFFVAREGRDAVCVIRDKGIGIPEEDQPHLFKAFHRGGNVGTRPGTGLGLLLVKRCAELHGGTVQINSKIGEGTTVTVRFPAF